MIKKKKQNKYRTGKVKRGRSLKRMLVLLCGFGGVTVFILLLSAGLARSYFALLDSDWLRVEEIRITGTTHIERDEILNAMMVPRNTSVLTLKTAELAERLYSLRWVEKAVVRIEPPKLLVVEVKERDPLAIIQADQLLLMDRDGKLFARADQEKSTGLTLVSGFSGMDIRLGGYMPALPLEEIKEFFVALARTGKWLSPAQISECRWTSERGFVLFTSGGAFPIYLGSEDFDLRLSRLEKLFQVLGERRLMELVTRIDMDYPSRGYVEGIFSDTQGSKGT
jgi:cell division protein FtsQ